MSGVPLPADLLSHLEQVDPDRWLAARLVEDAAARDELLALYALNDELARVAAIVREPMMGEMRLAWWSEALDAAAEGRGGRGHPVLEALAPALATGRLPREPLERMVEARSCDLHRVPFADEPALVRWLDGTAGALMSAAAVLLDPGAAGVTPTGAARAWGWAGLLRASEAWATRGRRWAPADWSAEMTAEASSALVRTRVEAALQLSRGEGAGLPTAAFPAVAYATLARDYACGRFPGPLAKRFKLLRAATLGRL